MPNQVNNPQKPMNTERTRKPVTPDRKEEDSLTQKAGDVLERLGEKVIKAGAPKIGKAIYNAGDKLEHMNDDKKTH
jgi:hypothetical protein